MPDPFSVGVWTDNVHHFRPIMVEQRTKTKQFRFFLRSWYNTTRIDPRAQNTNLCFYELKLSIVPGPKPMRSQRQDREEEPFHTISFRSTKRAHRRENAWYTTTDILKGLRKNLWVIMA